MRQNVIPIGAPHAEFATKLRHYRALRGFKQADLWREAKKFMTSDVVLDRTSINRYEKGQNLPRHETLNALAHALGVTVSDLVSPASRQASSVSLEEVEEGRVRIRLDRVVSYAAAVEILRLAQP